MSVDDNSGERAGFRNPRPGRAATVVLTMSAEQARVGRRERRQCAQRRDKKRTQLRRSSAAPPPSATRRNHKSSRSPLKIGCRTLPSADFALYSISTSRWGSTQIPIWAMRLA